MTNLAELLIEAARETKNRGGKEEQPRPIQAAINATMEEIYQDYHKDYSFKPGDLVVTKKMDTM